MSDPHAALHTYKCNGSADCVYRPRVQVTDNWGWCNGAIGAASGFHGQGCATKAEAWAEYRYEVRVKP